MSDSTEQGNVGPYDNITTQVNPIGQEEPVSKKIKLEQGKEQKEEEVDSHKISDRIDSETKALPNSEPQATTDSHKAHHHHHFVPNVNVGPIPHIHKGNHIHIISPKANQSEEAVASSTQESNIVGSDITEVGRQGNDKDGMGGNNSVETTIQTVVETDATTEATSEIETKESTKETTEHVAENVAENVVADGTENIAENIAENAAESATSIELGAEEVNGTSEEEKVKDSDLEDIKKMNTKQQILEIIRLVFPNRRHLGSLVYNPTTTWLTLQTSQLTGLKDEHFERFEELRESFRIKLQDEYYSNSVKYIPTIPPFPNDYINYLLEVKIPYRFIKAFQKKLDDGQIISKRELWGGKYGIYTDDSDILNVLTHLGFFTNNLDLKEWNPKWEPSDVIFPNINKEEEIKGDLSVTVLLLPGLDKYESVFKNGINSRNWKKVNKHNGLSIAVFNVKWEIEGAYLRDKSFFKRYQTEILYDSKYLKQQLANKQGWKFDVNYFKELRQKYSNIESEKQ